jgi:hypothetical protein
MSDHALAGRFSVNLAGLETSVLRAMTRRYVVGLMLYVGAFALTFVSVAASLALIVVLGLVFGLPEPFDRSKNGDSGGAVR